MILLYYVQMHIYVRNEGRLRQYHNSTAPEIRIPMWMKNNFVHIIIQIWIIFEWMLSVTYLRYRILIYHGLDANQATQTLDKIIHSNVFSGKCIKRWGISNHITGAAKFNGPFYQRGALVLLGRTTFFNNIITQNIKKIKISTYCGHILPSNTS